MMRLVAAVVIVAVFWTAILGVRSDDGVIVQRDGVEIMTWDQFIEWFCKHNPAAAWSSLCNHPTTTTTTTSTTTANGGMTTSSTSSTTQSSTTSLSALATQAVPWCHFNNGTTLPLGYTFMHTECALCQCTQSRSIRCTNLQCMPTYCVDDSTPKPRQGQCCPQCAYEKTSTSCIVNGISFPHGTLLRRTSDNIQCWCQLGGIECRRGSTTLFSGLDFWGNGTAVYVIVIVICIMLMLGTLLCCGGTFFFYYYYQRQQQAVQQNQTEYYNNAGWQPMPEDGQVVEGSAEEKQVEAEQTQYTNEYPTGLAAAYVPPPYALYDSSYGNQQGVKNSK